MLHRCLPILLIAVMAPCIALADDAPAADTAPLPIKVPVPSFSGTPLDYWSDHLEPANFRKRKPFPAPTGAVNAAEGKLATTSAGAPLAGELKQITDGEKSYESQHIVELKEGSQWIQIDLGSEHDIFAVVVWHYHASERVYFDVIVQGSNDPAMEEGVATLYNNDYDNSTHHGLGKDKEYVENYQGRLFDAKGLKARYVRLYSNGNTTDERNHYIEVEVWAKPVG